jgi:glycosyltransferase involved in cell wall biosynthesis
MEAMAMEIPCVAPRITGIPELIEDGADGLLFAPADEEELAAALLRLIGNPDLRRRLGEAARQRVLREYDLAANTARFAEILRRRLFPGHSLARQQHA